MDADYPEELLRGIPRDTPEFISEEGYPTQAVFKFDKYNASSRNDDGFCELSVNWYDDEGAIDTLTWSDKPKERITAVPGWVLQDLSLCNAFSV